MQCTSQTTKQLNFMNVGSIARLGRDQLGVETCHI